MSYCTMHSAELIYVGKRCTKHSLKQADINALIYQKAKHARIVVRLKGGDPYIFGRGHEEQVYLEKRGGTTKDHQLSEDVRKAVHTDATIVILMATRKLATISQLLIEGLFRKPYGLLKWA